MMTLRHNCQEADLDRSPRAEEPTPARRPGAEPTPARLRGEEPTPARKALPTLPKREGKE